MRNEVENSTSLYAWNNDSSQQDRFLGIKMKCGNQVHLYVLILNKGIIWLPTEKMSNYLWDNHAVSLATWVNKENKISIVLTPVSSRYHCDRHFLEFIQKFRRKIGKRRPSSIHTSVRFVFFTIFLCRSSRVSISMESKIYTFFTPLLHMFEYNFSIWCFQLHKKFYSKTN